MYCFFILLYSIYSYSILNWIIGINVLCVCSVKRLQLSFGTFHCATLLSKKYLDTLKVFSKKYSHIYLHLYYYVLISVTAYVLLSISKLLIYKYTTPVYYIGMHGPIDLSTFVFVPLTGVFEHVLWGLCSCHDTAAEIDLSIADGIHNHAVLEKPENHSPLFPLSAWP